MELLIHSRYIYCDETQFTEDVVLPTLYAAKKYIIPALVDKCIQYLEHNLNPDNVCLIYEQVSTVACLEHNLRLGKTFFSFLSGLFMDSRLQRDTSSNFKHQARPVCHKQALYHHYP